MKNEMGIANPQARRSVHIRTKKQLSEFMVGRKVYAYVSTGEHGVDVRIYKDSALELVDVAKAEGKALRAYRWPGDRNDVALWFEEPM